MENPKTALLIDEDRNSRLLLSIRLEDIGLRVLQAPTSEQARNILQNEKVDVVIAEWSLPDLDNDRLLRMAEPGQRPVFLFTEHSPENLKVFLVQSRVKAVVAKKWRHELLTMLVETLGLTQTNGKTEPAANIQAPTKPAFISPAASELDEISKNTKRILVVEDSWSIRHFVKRVLQDRWPDAVVLEAQNGLEALGKVEQLNIDVMVTDLEMPEMDGRELVSRLRENPNWGDKPIVVLSVYSREEVQEKFEKDPHVHFLVKPAAGEQIIEVLKPLIGDPKLLSTAVNPRPEPADP